MTGELFDCLWQTARRDLRTWTCAWPPPTNISDLIAGRDDAIMLLVRQRICLLILLLPPHIECTWQLPFHDSTCFPTRSNLSDALCAAAAAFRLFPLVWSASAAEDGGWSALFWKSVSRWRIKLQRSKKKASLAMNTSPDTSKHINNLQRLLKNVRNGSNAQALVSTFIR